MAATLAAAAEELAAVETVEPGDEVIVGRLGPHVVSAVRRYDDGTVTIVYFTHQEACYENRARDSSGYGIRHRLVERSLRPLAPDARVRVIRGNTATADRLRMQMQHGRAQRLARLAR